MQRAELAVPTEQIAIINTKFEDQLSGLLRYARFMEQETPQEWVALLGPDVVGLTHPTVTADITQRFVDFNREHGMDITPEDEILLLTASHDHDWGEIKIGELGVGDVSFDQKTEADDRVEIQIFDRVTLDLPKGPAKNLFYRAYYDVAQQKESRLGRSFNAIERLGYLQTAIRSYTGVDGKRIANWRGLVGNVLSNQIEKLLEYAIDYPYAAHILEEHAGRIDAMFAGTMAGDIPMDNKGSPSFDQEKFTRAHDTWKKSRGQKGGHTQ